MTPERYRQLCQLFDEAEEHAPPERPVFLDSVCPDAALRAAVEQMLADAEAARSRGFLATPYPMADALQPLPSLPEVGRRVGPYELRAVIGQGGMGRVYRAERVEGFRQVVALKMLRADLDSEEVARRFRNERQILAGLKHPHIAALLDGGTTAEGQPYLAMEFIEGEPIDRFCDNNRLDPPQRLQLLAVVCDAVHYAHQRMVIHRDLKPGNILVDTRGEPKILDFGIARVTDPELQATTAQTEAGRILGTLAYMSPEQVAGRPEDVDTRADVYALGVLVYQLLTGRLPHDLEGKSLPEAIRSIGEDEAPALSSVNKAFRGDLDTVVAKALSRDKARRYASASELAADIRHYLRNEPIAARPPGMLYQFGKFARRHKAFVGGVAAVFLALVLGVVGAAYGLIQAQTERDNALESAQQARLAVRDALRVISFSEPLRQPGFESVRKDLLEAALKHFRDLGQRHGEDRALQIDVAAAHLSLTQVLQELERPREALASAQESARLYEAVLRDEPASQELQKRLAFASDEVGRAHGLLRQGTEEMRAHRRALEIREQLSPTDIGLLAESYTNLGMAHAKRGELEQARALFERSLPLWEKYQAENPAVAWGQDALALCARNLGECHFHSGRLEKAEEYYRKNQELCARFAKARPRDARAQWALAESYLHIGKVLNQRGRSREALPEVQRACDLQAKLIEQSPDNPRWRKALVANYDRLMVFQLADRMIFAAAATRTRRAALAEEKQGKKR